MDSAVAPQGAAGDLLDAPAIGDDLDRTADRVGHLAVTAPRRDLERMMAHGPGADAVMSRADLAGLEIDRLLATLQPLEPGGVLERQRDGLRPVEVVGDDDGNGDLVAAGQGDGQVEVDEERLKHTNRRLRSAELSLGRDGAGGQAPGRDRVGQVDVETRSSLVVGDQFGPPEQGLGEILADADGVASCVAGRGFRGLRGQPDLLEVVHHLGPPCSLACRLNRREQQGDQDPYDQRNRSIARPGGSAFSKAQRNAPIRAVATRMTHAIPSMSAAVRRIDSTRATFSG